MLQIVGGRVSNALESYRQMLFGQGSAPKVGAAQLDPADLQKVVRRKGRLPLAQVLRCRLRHFTDGAVLGSQAFVQEQLGFYRRVTGLRERTRPRDLPNVTEWGGLMTLRGLRKRAY
jgi:hypothetical protein